jgi:hypothetical protein
MSRSHLFVAHPNVVRRRDVHHFHVRPLALLGRVWSSRPDAGCTHRYRRAAGRDAGRRRRRKVGAARLCCYGTDKHAALRSALKAHREQHPRTSGNGTMGGCIG